MTPGPTVNPGDELVDAIHATIAGRGYALLPAMGPEEWARRILSLGVILDTTRVELNPAVGTYLCKPGEVPMHTDHPEAEWIVWRCEVPDPEGTPQSLCDSIAVLESLSEDTRQVLMRTRFLAQYRRSMPARPFPVLSESGAALQLSFAPWLVPECTEAAVLRAWHGLAQAVENARVSFTNVCLRTGESLIIANGRMLHGRPPLRPGSPRRLLRTWLRLHR